MEDFKKIAIVSAFILFFCVPSLVFAAPAKLAAPLPPLQPTPAGIAPNLNSNVDFQADQAANPENAPDLSGAASGSQPAEENSGSQNPAANNPAAGAAAGASPAAGGGSGWIWWIVVAAVLAAGGYVMYNNHGDKE